jgi:CRISPR system Cascade subunit CasE
VTELNMLRLQPEPRALAAWAASTGQRALLADTGYALHAACKAVLGVAAPKPFYLRTRNGLQELIGYTSVAAVDVQRAVQLSLGTSDAAAALGAESLVIKAMPNNWRAGERFSFETRVAPVLRSRAQEPGRYVEVDAAYHPQCCGQKPGDRQAAYQHWMQTELARAGAAELLTMRAHSFALTNMARRQQSQPHQQHAAQRHVVKGLLPDLCVRGELRVQDPAAFHALLARGLGRHRSFGFGCLLLAPAGAMQQVA